MKAVTVRDAKAQLSQLIAEACRGELIVLTDGDKKVALEPRIPLDAEENSPELEAELLRAIDGPFAAYSSAEMRTIGEKVIRRKSGK